jgi:hypothetical protein
MNDTQNQALQIFFKSLDLLKSLNIVRSDVIFGDIGEFLCTVVFEGLTLVSEKTNAGFDAHLRDQKVQIKFSNSSDAKNIDLGDPQNYQQLIVVLGRNSAHRMDGDPDTDYLFYMFSSNEVKEHFTTATGYKLSRTKHFKKADKEYNIASRK